MNTEHDHVRPRGWLLASLFLPLLACVAEVGPPAEGEAGADGTHEVESALLRCSNGATVPGIDVSYYQGFIDWQAVAASGQRFAFIRISDGHFQDPRFDENWAGAKRAGLLRGVYQYFRASQDPISQANIIIRRVGRLGRGDLPVVLDLEEFDGMSAATTYRRALAWLRHVEQGTGRTPIIYTNTSTWWGLGEPQSLVGYPLWLASWGTSCPNVPSGWRTWAFHQYSAFGRVRGIAGDVDLNRFNGPLSVLRTLARTGPDCVFGDGLYCGGNGVKGDPRTLYRCTDGERRQEEICAMGCASMPAGQNDRCRRTDQCPLGDGLYCGGDMIGGGRRVLYRCDEGQVRVHERCSNRCSWEPVGTDDACR